MLKKCLISNKLIFNGFNGIILNKGVQKVKSENIEIDLFDDYRTYLEFPRHFLGETV